MTKLAVFVLKWDVDVLAPFSLTEMQYNRQPATRRNRRDCRKFDGVAGQALALILFCLCAFALVDDAAGQQLPPFSVSYEATPTSLVTINADGETTIKPQPTPGLITATLQAIGYTLSGGSYVPTGERATKFLTLTFLSSCNVNDGCDAFGLTTAGLSAQQRALLFSQMRLATLKMFIASGANLDEAADDKVLLYRMIEQHGIDSAHVSVMLNAGADVNAGAGTTSGLLAAATRDADVGVLMSVLTLDGINVDVKYGSGDFSVLGLIAGLHLASPDQSYIDKAGVLREAGATCHLEFARNNFALCRTSCSVVYGCDEFGLTTAGLSAQQRATLFWQISLPTLTMFVESGANLNEIVNDKLLLYLLMEEHGVNSQHVSVMLTAGANVNAGAGTTSGLLAAAARDSNVGLLMSILTLDGINVDIKYGEADYSILDYVAQRHLFNPTQARADIARMLREKGATCHRETFRDNLPLCRTSCSVVYGCDEFGLTTAGLSAEQRATLFWNMSLPTLTMFVNSGANLNEAVNGRLLLYMLIKERGIDSQHVTVMLTAGANVKEAGGTTVGMLAYAISQNDDAMISALLSAFNDDSEYVIDVNVKYDSTGGGDDTSIESDYSLLDYVAVQYQRNPAPGDATNARINIARSLRQEGARCFNDIFRLHFVLCQRDPPSP